MEMQLTPNIMRCQYHTHNIWRLQLIENTFTRFKSVKMLWISQVKSTGALIVLKTDINPSSDTRTHCPLKLKPLK